MKLPNENSPLVGFLEKSGQLILLSIAFCVTSIPVVTLGSSLAALYYAVTKSVRSGRGGFMKEYLSALRSGLRVGIPLTLLCLIYLILSGGTLYFAYAATGMPGGLRGAFAVVGGAFLLAIVLILPYAPILLSRLDQGVIATLKTSFYFAVLNWRCTLKLVAVMLGSSCLLFLLPYFLIWIPGIACYVASFAFEPAFQVYLKQLPEAALSEDPWYIEL